MILGHVGLAVSIIGIACTQNYSIEKDLRMQAGDRVQFADYEFVFTGIKEKNGPNYDGFKLSLIHICILKPVDNYVRVRGYTDNQPINNEIFRSNWTLSAARAEAVLNACLLYTSRCV